MVATGTNGTPGAAVDAQGRPVFDPTPNVLGILASAVERQDDLRIAAEHHTCEMASLRAEYDDKLRAAESARIDAIRAVDVAAVQRAAEVAAEAVQTLAAQVPITAEAVRTSLAAALNPILNDIAELRKVQYEQQGQKSAGADPIVMALAELQASQARDEGTSKGADRHSESAIAVAAAKSAKTANYLAATAAGAFFLNIAIAIASHGKY